MIPLNGSMGRRPDASNVSLYEMRSESPLWLYTTGFQFGAEQGIFKPMVVLSPEYLVNRDLSEAKGKGSIARNVEAVSTPEP